MPRSTLYRAASVAARAILGIIFGLSALSKLSAPGIFQADVAAYHILPAVLVGPFALALPWIEAMLALYLIAGLFLRTAAIAAAGLLLLFTAALAIDLLTGNTAHGCGCLQASGLAASIPALTWLFGGLTIGVFDVARDLVLAGLGAVISLGDCSTLSLDTVLFGAGAPEAEPPVVA
ncbi:MAG: MauE/DoxX family redox-associated membrane protein [Chloroflexota bacterium]